MTIVREMTIDDYGVVFSLWQTDESMYLDETVSLKYYLGGYSTNHNGKYLHSQVWDWSPAKPAILTNYQA